MTQEQSTSGLSEAMLKKIEAFKQERRAMKQSRIEKARVLGEQVDAEVIGVWGHLTNIGAREYAVYKKKDEDFYFVILGRKEEFESYDAPEEIRKRAKRLVMGSRESIKEFEIKSIDPQRRPNGIPLRSIEEFLML